jgi:DNA-directed RNA polymerase specialized sigma subunit
MSKESPEVLSLINKAKDGDEYAWEELIDRYKKMMSTFKDKVKTDKFFDEAKDIESILNVCFVEAVNSYNPEKAKFGTYLTLWVRFKFLGYYLKEKMIPITNNGTNDHIIDKLLRTEVTLTDDAKDFKEASKNTKFIERYKNADNQSVNFNLDGHDLDMPLGIFVEDLLLNIADSHSNKEDLEIFKFYTGLVLNNEIGLISKMEDRFGKSISTLKKSLNSVYKTINNRVTYKETKQLAAF